VPLQGYGETKLAISSEMLLSEKQWALNICDRLLDFEDYFSSHFS